MRRTLADFLDITVDEARRQWTDIRSRPSLPPGSRQVDFVPVETLLCLAGMLLVEGGRFGSSSAHRAPTPVPELARLLRRPPTSITSKMANLEGSRPKGALTDHDVWLALHSELSRLAEVYRTVMAGARSAGIGAEQLPDFLAVEHGGTPRLLGQDEVEESLVERLLREAYDAADAGLETERETITRARIGQHRFARAVLHNCGWACAFCGFSVGTGGIDHLLRASHIKPWRASGARERTDPTNGVAACPTHDAAFDSGLITIGQGDEVIVSSRLRQASEANPAVRAAFSPPILRASLGSAVMLHRAGGDYVRWHREHIYAA